MEIKLDYNKRYQKFEGFGASGAWCAQLVGGWENKDEISRLLFSDENGIADPYTDWWCFLTEDEI